VTIPRALLRRAESLATQFPWVAGLATGENPISCFMDDWVDNFSSSDGRMMMQRNPLETSEMAHLIFEMHTLMTELKDLNRQYDQHNRVLHSGIT
jgi:hypothetical protein